MTKQQTVKKVPAVSARAIRDTEGRAIGLTITAASIGKTLTIRSADLTVAMAAEFLWHGVKQKHVDAAAIPRDPKTGHTATVSEKWAAVQAVYDRTIVGGCWNEEREGGGGTSYLLQALCILKPNKTQDQLREWLGKKTDAEKKALELNPAIAAEITNLKAAKAKDVDSDALMDELDDKEEGADAGEEEQTNDES